MTIASSVNVAVGTSISNRMYNHQLFGKQVTNDLSRRSVDKYGRTGFVLRFCYKAKVARRSISPWLGLCRSELVTSRHSLPFVYPLLSIESSTQRRFCAVLPGVLAPLSTLQPSSDAERASGILDPIGTTMTWLPLISLPFLRIPSTVVRALPIRGGLVLFRRIPCALPCSFLCLSHGSMDDQHMHLYLLGSFIHAPPWWTPSVHPSDRLHPPSLFLINRVNS